MKYIICFVCIIFKVICSSGQCDLRWLSFAGISSDYLSVEHMFNDSSCLMLTNEYKIINNKTKYSYYPKAISDLCLRKINTSSLVYEEMIFKRDEYENAEAICVANDGIYLVSKVESYDNIKWNHFIGIRVLDKAAKNVVFDTVIPMRVVGFLNSVISLPEKGIGLFFLTNAGTWKAKSNLIFLRFIPDEPNILVKKLLDEYDFSDVDVNSWSSDDSISLTIKGLSDMGAICKEVVMNMDGNILHTRDLGQVVPDYKTCNNAYIGFEPVFTQKVDRYFDNGTFINHTENIYKVVCVVSDSSLNVLKRSVLINDTSAEITNLGFIRTDDDYIVSCFMKGFNDGSRFLLWRLDGSGNVIWERKMDCSDKRVGDPNLLISGASCTLIAQFQKFENSVVLDEGFIIQRIGLNGELLRE